MDRAESHEGSSPVDIERLRVRIQHFSEKVVENSIGCGHADEMT